MRILVIGNGSIGRRHRDNLEALGVAAEMLPYRDLAAGLPQLEKSGGFDGLVIATATQIRQEIVEIAADRDIPFYIEKPLAFRPDDLARIAALAAPVAARSMVGYMMRYHPAFRHIARLDLSDIYRARFEIGHDVRQWRQNWRFSESYAARPDGGGVLLDLCHELDMARTLFPAVALDGVTSLGHARYPGVDFSDEIMLSGGGAAITVAMDYLSPVFLRRLNLRGTRHTVEFDLHAGQYLIATDGAWEQLSLPFERNEMFLAAMRDFLALVAGRPVSDVEHLPRLDLALPSSALVVEAYQARRFAGSILGDY